MIILPERNVARGKVLLPMFKSEWVGPSTQQGIHTRWRLDARLNDGFVKWRGWFDDREDVDAFLYALANDTLKYEKSLWRMSTPEWHPDIANVTYELATVTAFTSPTAGSASWSVPGDWNNTSNSLHAIGGGATSGSGSAQVPGSGGGAYAELTNLSLTKNATAYYAVGLGGLYTTDDTGQDGGQTWFNKTTNAAPTLVANGILAVGGNKRGAGGAAASCVGTTTYSGGSPSTSSSGYSGTGGGGAAGPNGAGAGSGTGGGGASGGGGANGGSASASPTNNNGTNGGNNRFGTGGGAGGLTTSINGSPGSNGGGGGGGARTARSGICQGGAGGTEFISEWGNYGPGGGGGGGGDDDEASTDGGNNSYGGAGGVYGGGGGGFADDAGSRGGNGGQGLLMVIYNPVINSFNMPMLGM